ncbi:MAG: hypothetical protein RLZZ461_1831 [Planctomycetota bacterium]|jgi:hypothetical protein
MWSRPRAWELAAAEKDGNAPGRAELFVEGRRVLSRAKSNLLRLTSAPASPSDHGGDRTYRTLERTPSLPAPEGCSDTAQVQSRVKGRVQDRHRPARAPKFRTGTDQPGLRSSGQAPTGSGPEVQVRHRPARPPEFRTGTDRPGLRSSGQAPTSPRPPEFRTGTDQVQDRHQPAPAPKFRTGTNRLRPRTGTDLSRPPEASTALNGIWKLGILGRLRPRARLSRVPVRSAAIGWIPCRIGPMTPGLSPLLLPPTLAATSGTLHTCA